MSHPLHRGLAALRSLFWRAAGLFTRKLRYQIVIPYLLLTTLFSVTGTYLLVASSNQSLHERFNKQLLDAASSAATGIAQVESEQIAGLRAMIFTQGFSEALARGDAKYLRLLIAPQGLNYGFDRVLVVTTGTTVLLDMGEAAANLPAPPLPQAQIAALVQGTRRPANEQDKVSGVLDMPGAPVFFTAAPVRYRGDLVGAVLAGTDLSRLLRQIARQSLSDAATLYGPGGTPLGSALTAAPLATAAIPTLPDGWYNAITANPADPARFRTVTLQGSPHLEALGVVPGRGPAEQPPAVFGVMLRTSTLDARLFDTLRALLPVFAFGLIAIVITGNAIATWIDKPVRDLVQASERIAHGDLDVYVQARRGDELGLLATRFNEMVAGLRQLLVVKDLFGRFVSPEVSEKLLAGEIELGGEQRTVTVLFSDLRNFTQLSERRSPAFVVEMLNEYFGVVVGAARSYGGIVNKFGGDSTLVIFGAPVDVPDHADRALEAALAMRLALDDLNIRHQEAGWEPLRQGIGISTGVVVAGQVGSEDRMEYTVVGDSVNVAKRLQEITKNVRRCDIVFSESTLAALSHRSRWRYADLGGVQVRGRVRHTGAYRLVGKQDDTGGPSDEASGRAGTSHSTAEADRKTLVGVP